MNSRSGSGEDVVEEVSGLVLVLDVDVLDVLDVVEGSAPVPFQGGVVCAGEGVSPGNRFGVGSMSGEHVQAKHAVWPIGTSSMANVLLNTWRGASRGILYPRMLPSHMREKVLLCTLALVHAVRSILPRKGFRV